MISDTPTLDAALDAARQDARPVVASAPGGRIRRPVDDPAESWWYYPPTEVVMEEATRLLDAHGLEIDFLGETLGQRGQVSTRWRLRHRRSGEYTIVTWEAEAFPDLETRTHAVLATVRHAKRSLHIELLKIPVVKKAREGDRIENGVIVTRAGISSRAGDKVTDGVIVDQAPPAGVDPEDFALPEDFGVGGLPDLGRLPGEDVAADAAARGEVSEPLDVAALYERARRWRTTTGSSSSALRAAAGLSTSGPLGPPEFAALKRYLDDAESEAA